MNKALEDVIAKVRSLPQDRQGDVVRLLEHVIADVSQVYVLDADEKQLIGEGLLDLDSGRVVSEAEMEAFWKRHHG